MASTTPIHESEQTVLNKSFNPSTGLLQVEVMEADGSGSRQKTSGVSATKITVSGDYTYIGKAAPGSAQSAAVWQCKKIDASVAGTTVITWADGNGNFDNIATDLTSLTYS